MTNTKRYHWDNYLWHKLQNIFHISSASVTLPLQKRRKMKRARAQLLGFPPIGGNFVTTCSVPKF